MTNNIFQDLIAKEIMTVYLNNILIFTQILEDHCKVLEVLAKYKLFLCPEIQQVVDQVVDRVSRAGNFSGNGPSKNSQG